MHGGEEASSIATVVLAGAIEGSNAAVIEERIRAHLGAHGVTVDGTAVDFLDVAGLRMIIRIGVAAVAQRTLVRLQCSPAILLVMALCDVSDIPGIVLE